MMPIKALPNGAGAAAVAAAGGLCQRAGRGRDRGRAAA